MVADAVNDTFADVSSNRRKSGRSLLRQDYKELSDTKYFKQQLHQNEEVFLRRLQAPKGPSCAGKQIDLA
jgi:hypothetical protein